AGRHSTEAATPGTNISQYHECGSAFAPAFTHIGTVATFTDRMELMCINKATDMLIIFTDREFHTKPIGFISFYGFCSGGTIAHFFSSFHWPNNSANFLINPESF